ncbi:MAG: hypothetical protein HZA24_09315 [Nitrospirae bacterium]|nr:hypothetical protein [Nitrospirota bacterium]
MMKGRYVENVKPKKAILVVASLTVMVSISLAGAVPAAFAHTECESDVAELGQRVTHIEEHLERESRRTPPGSVRKRAWRTRIKNLKEELQIVREHLEAAKAQPCPDTTTLEGQVQDLKHKLEHPSD